MTEPIRVRSTEDAVLLGAVAGMLLLAVVIIVITLSATRVSVAWSLHRTAQIETCRSIEDQTLRALCISGATR